MLDIAVLKDTSSKRLVTPGAKWDAVAHARARYGLSERRACHLIGIPRWVPGGALIRVDAAVDGAALGRVLAALAGR